MRILLLLALLTGITACGGSQMDMESHTLKVFTDQERKQIEELDETNTKAVVANGYRAVGSFDRQAHEGGTKAHVLFVKCTPGQDWNECAKTLPTAEEPQFFISGWWLNNTVEIGAVGWWRFATEDSFPLDCNTMATMDAFAVAQVPLALKNFIDTHNQPAPGLKVLDFPMNPNPNGPYGMGHRVEWHCYRR